eukprot:3399637-Pyramimonas_sp.AAC.1
MGGTCWIHCKAGTLAFVSRMAREDFMRLDVTELRAQYFAVEFRRLDGGPLPMQKRPNPCQARIN